ncbi:S8 family serine peptidase [Geoalkalibacter halelectricus]|uniref:S8 family serine peptidase n=1 Tax=Geoalkalibacter halelectricus TaxID=2847045 RepID=UPI003D2295C2
MKRLARLAKIVVALKLCLGVMVVGAPLEASQKGDFVPGELLVRQKAGAPAAGVRAALQAQGVGEIEEIAGIKVKRIRVPEHAMDRVRTALARNPNFEFVEPNFIAQGTLVPNDTSYASQWYLPRINAPEGWRLTTGSADIPIAIIDSGVDPSHADLGAKLLPGYNWLDHNTDTRDVQGHGTAVAGAAAAITDNGRGIAGVAWENPIMPLVVLNSSNSASYSNIASAIIHAVDQGVRVINVSIAGTSYSHTLQNAINYAWNRGALVFCAAANSNSDDPFYPAALNNAIAVAATDQNDRKASYSNYGDWITIAAPGSSIYTTLRGGGYGSRSGTSMASPVAAGLGALIWSLNPNLSNVEVLEILKAGADDLGDPGFDPIFGHGRINVLGSLSLAENVVVTEDQTPPVVALTSPADGSAVAGQVTLVAQVEDNVGVEKVEFFVNGQRLGQDTSAPYMYLWNAEQAASGWHRLSALATDAVGNVGLSEEVMVFVEQAADLVPPQVSISYPLPGAKLNKQEWVRAQASDNVGVARMELYINGALMSVNNSDTMDWRWMTHKERAGVFELTVKAYDAAGNVAEDSITVYK